MNSKNVHLIKKVFMHFKSFSTNLVEMIVDSRNVRLFKKNVLNFFHNFLKMLVNNIKLS